MNQQDLDQVLGGLRAELANLRNPVFTALGAWLVDILIDNEKYAEVVEDSGYDVSTFSQRSPESLDLSQYETVGEFLENEVGPNTVATFCSGHGFAAKSRASEAEELCNEALRDWVKADWPQYVEDGYIAEDLSDQLCENLVDCDFMQRFSEQKLVEAFSSYLPDAIKAREARRQAAAARERTAEAHRQKVLALGSDMLKQIASLTQGRRFEKSNYGELLKILIGLAESVPEGRDRVAAALEIKPWPFQTSTSVAAELPSLFRLKN
jgi:hypothetical protein